MSKAHESLPTTEAFGNMPILDQIPELTPLRAAFGALGPGLDRDYSPEVLYGHLFCVHDLLTKSRPGSSDEAIEHQNTTMDAAQQPFFDIVTALQSELSRDNSTTVLKDMIAKSRNTLNNTEWTNQANDNPMLATAEIMKLYLLTLLSGDRQMYKKMSGFMNRQHDSILARSPLDKKDVARVDTYIDTPWMESRPFIYTTSFGSEAQDNRKLTQYCAMRSFGELSISLDALIPHAPKVQDIMQQFFAKCQAFDTNQKFSNIVSVEWQVLPPGELSKVGQEIVEEARARRANDREPLKVDPERLLILEAVAAAWGPNIRYTRGLTTGRRSAKGAENEDVPNDYAVLVLQETDEQGNVTREHAVANSPITKNGLFVYRQDAQENGKVEDWATAFSLPKKDAETLGARKLVHPPRDTPNMIGTMAEKTIHLLTCPPEQFTTLEFHGVNAAGDVVVLNPRQRAARSAGAAALYTQIAAGLHELRIQYF